MLNKIRDWFKSIPSEIAKPGMKPAQIAFSGFTFFMDCVYRLFVEFAKLVLLVIVVIVSAQVFSRKVLGSSIRWSEEAALVFMAWTAFISMAIGVEKELHISITVIASLLPERLQAVLDKFNTLAIVFFGYILVRFGIRLTGVGMRNTLPATQWPSGIKYMIMPISGIFILYFALIKLFNLDKFRHLKIEGAGLGDGRTDQQILDEIRVAKRAKKAGKDGAEYV